MSDHNASGLNNPQDTDASAQINTTLRQEIAEVAPYANDYGIDAKDVLAGRYDDVRLGGEVDA